MLVELSNYNVAAADFSRQINELIKLTNSKGTLDNVLADNTQNVEHTQESLSTDKQDQTEIFFEQHTIDPFAIVDVSQLLDDISNDNPPSKSRLQGFPRRFSQIL